MPSYKITRGLRSHTAHVQEGRPFEVPAKSTLLMAAHAAGIDWPYGCRVGLCGQCRCKLLHGQVSPLGDMSMTLDQSSIEQGYILACRSLLDSNILILPPDNQSAESDEMSGKILSTNLQTAEIMTVHIQLDQPMRTAYFAGQYARLSVPDVVPPRCFSFGTACRGDGVIEFHVRLFPDGQLASWLRETDRSGEGVTLSQPLGEIGLRNAEHGQPLLFVAGGTGVSPILAMIEELACLGEAPPAVTFVYAARDQAHLYVTDQLKQLRSQWRGTDRFKFIPILSREAPSSDWQGLRGHIFDHLDEIIEENSANHAFLCGPPGLVDATELTLLKGGWDRARISADRFLPAFD
ncbi:MAG: 2Fe-2S iron-sulfur cluster binding domain-containing protein [Pseudomonadota bacterium]